ncbi:39S ribosomal protein L52, mitochondrial [Microplitis mediator]|uniref:39S ribosomal protein L52, mitochondrial n=1 Tax=Microplitis mediator TaxID=375433 RepID=UPI002552D2A9|nr:39S ribosomal protein L52, mitochondrial [Microplitis mediator]
MAFIEIFKMNKFIKLRSSIDIIINNVSSNKFHVSSVQQLDQKWRKKNRLTMNPNAFGPLTNYPDYSYADGRPSPFGVRQLGRINKQRNIFAKIEKLSGEIDYAVERYNRIQNDIAEKRKNIIDNKLKPKGNESLLDKM